jgi:hypothetical protein
MAIPGPSPKEGGKRERRNEPTFPAVELSIGAGGKVKAPVLPRARKYLPATRAWYTTWSRSPQASQFTTTDWLRLHMLAELVDAYFREPSARVLAEIRLNEAKLGATAEDRLRLRWRMAENIGAEERGEKAAGGTKKRRKSDPRLKLVRGGQA